MARKINSLSDESLQKLKRELQKSQNSYSNLSRRLASQRGHEAVWMPPAKLKAYNESNTTIKQYQPVIYGNLVDSSGEVLDFDDFKPNNRTYGVIPVDEYIGIRYRQWGVVQEEIAPGQVCDLIIRGATPIRVKYDGSTLSTSPYILPASSQDYARKCKYGNAYRVSYGSTPDADDVVIEWTELLGDSDNIGLFYTDGDLLSTSLSMNATTTTAYGISNFSGIDRTCFTKSILKTAGSVSWGSFSTLTNNAYGIEAVEDIDLFVELTANVIFHTSSGTYDGPHEIDALLIVTDNSDSYITATVYDRATLSPRNKITVSGTDYASIYNYSAKLTYSRYRNLQQGYRLYPVFARYTGSNSSFIVDRLSVKFTELPR